MAGRPDPLTRQLLSTQNLLAALARAVRGVREGEGVYDEDEVLHAENDPHAVIADVRALLNRLDHPIPCDLAPIPKADRKARAYYWIPLRYQIGWLAILQILGPPLDQRMPNWSFGYRLRRTRLPTETGTWLWDEYPDGGGGPYLGFAQSWKPFRRHINIVMRHMLGAVAADDDAETKIEQDEEVRRPCRTLPRAGQERGVDMRRHRTLPELGGPSPTGDNRIWYAKVDLSKFFPSVSTVGLAESWIREIAFLFGTATARTRWLERLQAWMSFKDVSDPAKYDSLGKERLAPPRGLPVGLSASGFLANLAVLSLDREVDDALQADPEQAVWLFRYVDDHVVLASTRVGLLQFLGAHVRRLHARGLSVSWDKLDPPPLRRALLAQLALLRAELGLPPLGGTDTRIAEHFAVDGMPTATRERLLLALCDWLESGSNAADLPGFPTEQEWFDGGALTEHQRGEFVSTTLQRMSLRADEEVELLDELGLDDREADLLDLAHPGAERTHELRHDTLVAFAAGQLVRSPLTATPYALEGAEGGRVRRGHEHERPARRGPFGARFCSRPRSTGFSTASFTRAPALRQSTMTQHAWRLTILRSP